MMLLVQKDLRIAAVNDVLRQNILLYLSKVLNTPVELLKDEMILGVDIKPSFVSDFKYNELDALIEDLRDIGSGAIAKEWKRGDVKIESVGDCVKYISRCYDAKPKLVSNLIFKSNQ